VGVQLTPLQQAWVGNLRRILLLLLSGAALVLVMACANVASLLLTQAIERRQEISVRTALGASRLRLARQLLTESLLLSLLGCAGGLLLALAATRLLDMVQAAGLRSFVHVGLDARVVAFAVAVSLLCGAGFGLAPLWAAWRTNVAGVLKEGTRGSPRQRLQSVLVAAEVALALALLVGAGLSVRGFQKLQSTRLGYRTDVLTMRLDIGDKHYSDESAVLQLLRRLDERLGALPGVQSVGLEGPGLPTLSSDEAGFTVENRDPAEDASFSLAMHHVSPGYFSTLGVPLLQGRFFTAGDDQKAETWSVVVGAGTARRLWPDGDPLGKRVKIGRRDFKFPWFKVIGVVGDARHLGLATDRDQWRQEPQDVYFTALQFPPKAPPQVNILVRPASGFDAAVLATPVRREIAAIDPGFAVYDTSTLAERLQKQTARPRLLARLMTVFSLLSLVLAAVGIHGIVANSVTRRTREIGIRIALGADRGAVVGWIVKRAALLALAGIAAGLGVAAILSRLMEHQLYGLPSIDPPAFAGGSILLLGIAVLTSWLAAHRASRIEPSAALRAE
ncbi:MAG TPA: FtsX-like permease family protein, partial [Thermoanaerobaculia bacterium]|nr:FtsX-like permease family protein [Thermoanaerobaculia bacterium]